MQLSHTLPVVAASFDDPNLVSAAGLVPVMKLAERAGLTALAKQHLSVPTDKGANAGLKVASLVGGMLAGADSIDDMAVLRHGGMGKLFTACYAPSTLGSFLRAFTFGHVRQLDAVGSRLLIALNAQTPLLRRADADDTVFVDMDDTVIATHGHQKQGAGVGYSKITGLNALLVTACTATAAPIVVGQRLRRGRAGSAGGAGDLLADALATVRRMRAVPRPGPVLVRCDSAFYSQKVVASAVRANADVSITLRQNRRVRSLITGIDDSAWTPIRYPNAIHDPDTGQWVSDAEVAETPFTAFIRHRTEDQVPGRLIVRRVKQLSTAPTLFDTYRYHAFFTTTDPTVADTVTADRIHRDHAIIEQTHADLKNSALAHLPSGRFAANSAWLVLATITYNLTRTAGTITGTDLAKATSNTIRRTLINIPTRTATSARRTRLHLPQAWPWETAWTRLFTHTHGPPATN